MFRMHDDIINNNNKRNGNDEETTCVVINTYSRLGYESTRFQK